MVIYTMLGHFGDYTGTTLVASPYLYGGVIVNTFYKSCFPLPDGAMDLTMKLPENLR